MRAVDGVSFSVGAGEMLGVVGESGSGKSVTVLSIMRLIRDPDAIIEGRGALQGPRPAEAPPSEMRDVRGAEIAMIFQEPMTALNPVYTIGWQIAEQVRAHEKMSKAAGAPARRRAARRGRASRGPSGASTTIRTSSRAACGSAR